MLEEIIIYAGIGKKCSNPRCPCFFMNSHDEIVHKRVCQELLSLRMGWRKSNYDDGWILRVERDPELARQILLQGTLSMGEYNYTLNAKHTIIKRRKVR